MANKREIVESPLEQGQDEEIAYALDTAPWGGTPTGVAVTLWNWYDNASPASAADKLTGSPSVASDVITTPVVSGLVAGTPYRLEILFTAGGNTWEAYCYINAKP